ncbi:MAG: hypothetical protein K2V38_19040 [Gemmataceae bacterium]|nr:hypothetical protein [Gemmataceae bacterium]
MADGLSEAETKDIEYQFGFHFPPDLRALLQTGLPVGDWFPDWRGGDVARLECDLNWPLEGMQFDIKNNAFWLGEWGPRPASLADAFEVAARAVAAAPRLIPVYSHRYIPADPPKAGNPVFSVYQTDVIVYGADLLSYFAHEFHTVARWHTPPLDVRAIRFWGERAR